MNLLLFDQNELSAEGSIELLQGDERHRHVLKVLRPDAGSRLRVGVVNGRIGSACVASVSRQRIELRDVALTEAPPAALPVTLALALPRPKFLGRILQATATMGVKEIVLLHSARVEKSYWETSLLASGAIERQLRLGLEQGRDTVLPRVSCARRFPELVERLPDLLRHSVGLVADGAALTPMPRSRSTSTTLVIGPEGGFLDREIEQLEAVGMNVVNLGTRPLRVETAVAVALGRLSD